MNPISTYRHRIVESAKWSYAATGSAGLLICLFLFTGLDKLYNYAQFKDALSKSRLLSDVAGIVAWSLPVVEILIAVALIIPVLRRSGFKAALFVLAVFTVYLSYMMVFAPKLPCMCAGVLESLSWKSHIGFNAVMMVLAIIGISASRKSAIDGTRAPPE